MLWKKYSEMKNSCENIARQIVKVINPKMKFFLKIERLAKILTLVRFVVLTKHKL